MIFFHNAEPDRPEDLAYHVKKEMFYFKNYLDKAIRSMDVRRYALEWEKDEDLTYTIFPAQVLEVEKPKNRIFIKGLPDTFSRRIPIIKENSEQVIVDSFEETDDGIILILEEDEVLSSDELLYYGHTEIQWTSLASGFEGDFDQLEDREGNTYRILRVNSRADSYIVQLTGRNRIPSGIDIFINSIPLSYDERRISTLKGVHLYDNKGELDFSIVFEYPERFKIRTYREIRGRLHDGSGRFFNDKFEQTEKGQGVWIALKEPEDEQLSAEDDKRTRIELFLELLSSSIDYSVWERPDVRPRDRGGDTIRVLRTNHEENRILLEREPKTDIIYPSKTTYQLEMQRNAVKTLMFQPAPEHRNLLRLFEPYDDTQWENPSAEYKEKDLSFQFLTDRSREGTDEQIGFVLKALNSPDYAILEGPPGSGKTTAISELIFQLLQRGQRILLSASTHVAIDNVLEQLEEHFRDKGGPMANGIVPLRIGREQSLSPDVMKYQIDKRRTEFEEKFRNEEWYSALPNQKQDEYLNETIIATSNLICGTTIGILLFPHFKKKRRGEYVDPRFDYLVIDEASKTTFQEFLVPAIHAKKWVVVGDIRQLSPYADTLNVRVNLDGILKNRAMERALVLYMKMLFNRGNVKVNNTWISPPRFIYVDDLRILKAIASILPSKIQKEIQRAKQKRLRYNQDWKYAIVTKDFIEGDYGNTISLIPEQFLRGKRFELMETDIIFVEESVYRRMPRSFPHSHILIRPKQKWPDVHEFQHLHWLRHPGKGSYAYRLYGNQYLDLPWEICDEVISAIGKDWAGELSWRMKRVHELALAQDDKDVGRSKGFYLASMHSLMPPDNSQSRDAWLKIKKIGQVSLTSILSSIQDGVTPDWKDKEDKTVMSHGLNKYVKEPRYEKLRFQHRMHPEISSIPRDIFYRGEALHDDEYVQGNGRTWSYPQYPSRVTWINVAGAHIYRNSNDREANRILSELKAFVKWSKMEKKEHTVVILSFYEGQRKLMRDKLRREYPKNGKRETRFDIDGIQVRNYTVDRVQGREGDIVFLSMVQNRKVGFMDSPNRLNVALTRAKYQLVLIGDHRYFSNQQNSVELRKIASRSKLVS